MNRPLVEIHDMHASRGGAVSLTISDLKICEGERLAIVGPNGAGKSTLLLVLARLLRIQRGRLSFAGQAIDAMSELDYRRQIALVLQDPLLFDMTVAANVAVGLRFRRMDRGQIERHVTTWLALLGIAHLRDRRAQELSGGEAQRVSLARALALEPRLLLLDEPFAALDPPTRHRLTRDMSQLLAETGTTTVIVTHDLNEAMRIGSRIAVIIEGQLRGVAAPSELAQVADADVQAFVSDAIDYHPSLRWTST